jgi:hypothetical protein
MGEQEALQLVEIGGGEWLVAAEALHGELILVDSQEVASAQAELLELIAAEQGCGIELTQAPPQLLKLRHADVRPCTQPASSR